MARQESDREDLWAEAVGLTSRVELAVNGSSDPVLVGYRDDGCCSIYFGPDVMLQFTPAGGLRRAYRHGELFRTQGETLARLRRQRTSEETTLLRADLTGEELAAFRDWAHHLLRELLENLQGDRVVWLREVNQDSQPLAERIAQTLAGVLAAEVFLAPAIGKRR